MCLVLFGCKSSVLCWFWKEEELGDVAAMKYYSVVFKFSQPVKIVLLALTFQVSVCFANQKRPGRGATNLQ